MASPQLENGYTRIANELLEAIARAPLSAREFRVLFALVRETYGWTRKASDVTAAQVGRLTGLQRTQAARTLRRLKARQVLVNGAGGLGVQKDYEQWQLPRGSNLDRSKLDWDPSQTRSDPDPESGPSQTLLGGPSQTPYKERSKARKKGLRAAEPPSPHHQRVMDTWARLFQERTGSRPDITARDGAIVRRLLRNHPADEVLEIIELGVRRGTPFMRERIGHDLRAISSEYNPLLELRKELRGG
jgi:phage replication O-like protein O